MRILGLDIGEKRIGIAISDPLGWTAQGHSVLHRQDLDTDLRHIKEIYKEFKVDKIVLGLPRNMNGSLGAKALEIQEFGELLAGKLAAEVEYWDERLSTQSAERILIEADVSRRRRKQVIDKLAAVNILQGYLDYLASGPRRI
ncbi:MAG: Holliday junction resolvase RuvX [Syntrophomonadaceae bacterium]|jgi:putative Holliday junction resolvase